MTRPSELGRFNSSVGVVDVLHRLALGVEPRDGLTGRPAVGAHVVQETVRGALRLDEVTDSRFLLSYGPTVGPPARFPDQPPRVTILLEAVGGRWVPRRFAVTLHRLADVVAVDVGGAHPFLPATERLLRPWLMPGRGYPVPRGTTGLRVRIVRDGAPVRWARLEVFAGRGTQIGRGHADAGGWVLVVLPTNATTHPPKTRQQEHFQVVLRISGPDPAPPDVHGESLIDLPAEPVALPRPIDDPVARGATLPAGFRTAPDRAEHLVVGAVTTLPDQIFNP